MADKFYCYISKVLLKIIGKHIIRSNNNFFRTNKLCTLYINLKYFKFKDAIKLPILIYGPCSLCNLGGRIKITEPLYKGMVKIGVTEPVRSYANRTVIDIKDGTVIFGKEVVLRRGLGLCLCRGAKVTFKNKSYIGDNCTIIALKEVEIGNNTRFANDIKVLDSDLHFTVNTETRVVKKNEASIIIGDNNWIGAFTTIKKGTHTPKGTIVAGPNAMLGKDYTKTIPENSLIAGSPAKLLVENIRRITDYKVEAELQQYFGSHNETYIIPDNVDIESICNPM